MQKYVNRKEGICVAVMSINPEKECGKILKRIKKGGLGTNKYESWLKNAIITELNNREYMKKSIVGIAKCHELDTFDKNIGMKIATHKAKRKYYNYISSVLYRVHFSFLGILLSCIEASKKLGEEEAASSEIINQYKI